VVDEVLSVGDAQFQQKCMGKIDTIASKEGRTILFVSHNMPALEALCSTAILLQNGKISETGDTTEIVQRYFETNRSGQQGRPAAATKYIRSLVLRGEGGELRNSFVVGEQIIFDVELHTEKLVAHPVYSIGICNDRGERLVTLNTGIQQNASWSFAGCKLLKVTWRNVPLNVGSYQVETNLWDHSRELETLRNYQTLEIIPSDVYGTGMLPDPRHQGCIVPDAIWQM
jgi:lipopolysaccharide transport system ATP-binding protein